MIARLWHAVCLDAQCTETWQSSKRTKYDHGEGMYTRTHTLLRHLSPLARYLSVVNPLATTRSHMCHCKQTYRLARQSIQWRILRIYPPHSTGPAMGEPSVFETKPHTVSVRTGYDGYAMCFSSTDKCHHIYMKGWRVDMAEGRYQ